MAEGRAQVEINGRLYDTATGEIVGLKQSKHTVVRTHKVIDGITAKKPISPQNKPRNAHPRRAQVVHSKGQKTRRLHPAAQKASPNQEAEFSPKLVKRWGNGFKETITTSVRSEKISRFSRDFGEVVSERIIDKTVIDEIAPAAPIFPSQNLGSSLNNNAPKQVIKQTSHTEVRQTSWFKRNVIPVVATFAGLALLSGYFIYNSLPTLTMRVAASRAGFSASVPSYQPSGFSFSGPVSYSAGKVVVRFDSKNDDSYYILTQQTSDWDSTSLLANYVETEAEFYQPAEVQGLTVYLYDDSRATWVDSGVWYVLDGTANLNSEQLFKIAASL